MMKGYCAHGIVAHTKVGQVNGTVSDAWACCNCGMQFMPDASLPTFTPEPSYLHNNLARIGQQRDELLEALEELIGWECLAPIEAYEKAVAAIAKARGQG